MSVITSYSGRTASRLGGVARGLHGGRSVAPRCVSRFFSPFFVTQAYKYFNNGVTEGVSTSDYR